MDGQRATCSNRFMTSPRSAPALVLLCLGLWWGLPTAALQAKSSVWKVTSPAGQVLYLGGSVHSLEKTDYPLPPAYNLAFDLSQRLAFEDSPGETSTMDRLEKLGVYPRGDELKNHVDPRTYEYILRAFARSGTPREKLIQYRPWFLAFLLSTGPSDRIAGVEGYMMGRARTYQRPIEGLESNNEHLQVFSGLTDRQAEALLLLRFIQTKDKPLMMTPQARAAWRNGDADFLERMTMAEYRDFPAMADRLLGQRNRAWLPKIEGWIRSGKTYFVLAGAAHMGGPNGLLSLLRGRGYQIEQL